MTKKQYTLGVDFGTLSARAVLLRLDDGVEVAEATVAYPHGVMDRVLPSGKRLPPQFALQYPNDYLFALRETVRGVLQKASASASEIAGIGIDFTACTLLAVDADGKPLCDREAFLDEPLSYALLWKHHGAQEYADRMNRVAEARGEDWLRFIGGKISSESMFPKILQILKEAPSVYAAADRFTEAGDWIVRLLTGKDLHSRNIAGYKAQYVSSDYPSEEYLCAVDAGLRGLVGTKVSREVRSLTEVTLQVSEEGETLSGLAKGTPLALAMIDAQAAIPALNVTRAGELLAVIGTSACYIIHSNERHDVPCVFGAAKDAILPGFYTYEAGQAGLGDSFDWFVQNAVPAEYVRQASEKGMGIHAYLREKAERLKPGESGLLAMDWLNGDRSLKNDGLSSMILGLTVQTRPEEIYRALIEATAYGARRIAEDFEANGIPVRSICATGGIARKDPMMMQIYADVTGREVRVGGTGQAGARGSAILGAVAGGIFRDLGEAARFFAMEDHAIYRPNPSAKAVYDLLYREYRTLYEQFGKEDGVLCRLNRMRNQDL
ncbi:MAG: ribulokinase [Clostridia bacterium]|nr:ribulokinase [Clostridia bacterium]